MIKLLAGLAAAVAAAGCAHDGADVQQGGGERVGTSAAALTAAANETSTDESAAAEATSDGVDEAQGGGERVGGGTGADAALDVGEDEPQGGGERVGTTTVEGGGERVGGVTIGGVDAVVEEEVDAAADGDARVGD